MNLWERFDQLKHICVKYGLPAAAIERDMDEMEHFSAAIPVIGSFNTGKSSLLNALTGMPLLPTGIVAQTSVPTELVYSPRSLVTVFRGNLVQRVGISELRNHQLDLTDVTLLRVECPSPFLRSIEAIRLVDMPGLDSGIPSHMQGLRRYLSQSLGYILVFSADEPVIKESVSRFLAELRLHEVPVFAVLTKCDKVTPETAAQEQLYLEDCFARQLDMPGTPVHCIRSKGVPDVAPLRNLLELLQQKALVLKEREFFARLREHVRPVLSYLELRMMNETLPLSELNGQIAQLLENSRWFSSALEKNTAYYSGQLKSCMESVLEKIRKGLADISGPLADLQRNRESAAAYTDEILQGLVAASIRSDIDPLLVTYRKSILRLLSLHQEDSRLPSPSEENVSAVDAVLKVLPGSIGVFDGEGSPTERLDEMVQNCLMEGIGTYLEEMEQVISAPVREDFRSRKQALQDLKQRKQQQDSELEEQRSQLGTDLETVRSLAESPVEKEEAGYAV